MIDVYRLSIDLYSDDLSGTGASISGGRWNRPGHRVLYTAGSRSLATLEILVHASVMFVPKTYFMLTIRVPEDSLLSIPLNELPANLNEPTPPTAIKGITEHWLAENRFLGLKVPSAVVEGEYNFLINPLHSRAVEVVITDKQPYRFDSRLMRE